MVSFSLKPTVLASVKDTKKRKAAIASFLPFMHLLRLALTQTIKDLFSDHPWDTLDKLCLTVNEISKKKHHLYID